MCKGYIKKIKTEDIITVSRETSYNKKLIKIDFVKEIKIKLYYLLARTLFI